MCKPCQIKMGTGREVCMWDPRQVKRAQAERSVCATHVKFNWAQAERFVCATHVKLKGAQDERSVCLNHVR